MAGKVAEIELYAGVEDGLARSIVHLWDKWNQQRSGWREENLELRNFLYATDTSTTSVGEGTNWRNKTTLPKLTQIMDNLHANYISALFPNDDWLKWEGYSLEDGTLEKTKAIEAYMSNKVREGNFRSVVSDMLHDYIQTGNVLADHEFVRESHVDENGEEVVTYVGPKAIRYNPEDVVFNPTASDVKYSPKIIRAVKSIGECQIEAERVQDQRYLEAVQRHEQLRVMSGSFKADDYNKALGFSVDGFGDLQEYYQSGYVELLTFRGNIHDPSTGTLLKDHVIVVMDRRYVIFKQPFVSWRGDTLRHCVWRKRPDNLWGMGPLNNLVGMQYRIDHLENLKADVFDMIATPMFKIKGDVETFTWTPGGQVHIPDDGDVSFLVPDTNALNADTQIALLEQKMEEYAGAPRQAMGVRTPGEKTMYEVQSLENAAGRIFQEKVVNFEVNILEPLLNDMLESARRNMDGPDIVRTMDDDLGVQAFMTITKEDITAKGKIRPVGARHFAQKAQMLQNLTGIFNSPLGQMISPHTSSVQMTRLIEDLIGLQRYQLFSKNIALFEQGETQQTAIEVQAEVQAQAGVQPDQMNQQPQNPQV